MEKKMNVNKIIRKRRELLVEISRRQRWEKGTWVSVVGAAILGSATEGKKEKGRISDAVEWEKGRSPTTEFKEPGGEDKKRKNMGRGKGEGGEKSRGPKKLCVKYRWERKNEMPRRNKRQLPYLKRSKKKSNTPEKDPSEKKGAKLCHRGGCN